MKTLKLKIFISLLALMTIVPVSQAQRSKKVKKQDKEQADALKDFSLNTFKFRSIGPALTSGRIADLAVNPNYNSEFYVAAAAGGVWKTTNSGVTFKPIFDDQGSYSIGCLAMDPNNSNVIWVGTGENNNQRSVSFGDGLYKSCDGGDSWKKVGLEKSEHIGMIAIDPRNSDVVFVAAYGPVWSAGGDRGIYKTMDGGTNWEKVLDVSEHTGFNEIHMDPRDPDVLYATAHQRRRRQWTYLGGGPESGIYKSTDAGQNWIKINKGLPSGDKGRIGMDISPANPEILYAVVEAKRGQAGFFKSTNRGASWQKMSDAVTSGNYYQEVIADPVNPDRVYIMNTFTLISDDGGKNFRTRGEKSKHWDNHALWIDPMNPKHTLEGGDGGLYESFDDGVNWRFFTNLPITQFYKVHVDNAAPFYNVMGGTQDNYSLLGPSQTISTHGIVTSDWIVTSTGDGFESGADPIDPNIVYTQSQHGNLQRFDKKSGESIRIQPKPLKGEKEYNWNWDAPLLVSPHGHTIYFAANKLFKSIDRGDSWEVISGELDRNIDRNLWPIMGKMWPMDAIAKNGSTSRYGACVSLDESRMKAGLIYAGTDDGQINITADDGKTWTKINQFPGVPEYTYVYDLLASKHDVNTVFAAFNNHKSGDFTPYVYKSVDQGKTWMNISSNLPEKGAVYALEQDHVNANILFAGTEYGVFVTLDGGQNWKALKAGLPTANVRDMMIQERENDLVIATFGRGFYILDNYAAMREISEDVAAKEGYLFAVENALMYNTWRPLGGLGSREKGFQGEDYYVSPNPETGAQFIYWVKDGVTSLKSERTKSESKAFKAGENIPYPTLEEFKAEGNEFPSYLIFTIKDDKGNFVRELRSPIKKGLNKLVWDMEYPANTSVDGKDASATKGLPSSGIFVLPGKYQVSMAKNVKGEVSQIAGPVSFEIKDLDNKTLAADQRAELIAFKLKAIKLLEAMDAVETVVDEMSDKIAPYKAATKASPGVEGIKLLKDILALEAKVKGVEVMLGGDRDYGRLDLDAPYALNRRAGSALFDIFGYSGNVPGSSKRNYEIAADEFAPILEKVKALQTDFEMIEKHMESTNAPITKGRLPNWKK